MLASWIIALLVLIGLLLAAVFRFSRRYLAGSPAQASFTRWTGVAAAAIVALVTAADLLVFTLAWTALGLCLHQLLTLYPDRPAALLAARKKFVISRLGDLPLLAALFLTRHASWSFADLNAAAPDPAVALCLAAAVLIKSAQFPFHTWLPDTMETPSPVSALMHAGIINAGAVLLLKTAPLLLASPAALALLTVTGGFTAVFASWVMLTQASIKRQLAFSTVAQMGFVMVECGLGQFSLALVHVIGHALYKAHAFLASGTAVTAAAPTPRPRPLALLTAALVTAAVLVPLTAVEGALAGLFALALIQLLAAWWTAARSRAQFVVGALAGLAFASLHFAFAWTAGRALPAAPASALAMPVLTLFLASAIAWHTLPHWAHTAFGQRLWIWARNGFYCNTLANRWTHRVWPVAAPLPKTIAQELR